MGKMIAAAHNCMRCPMRANPLLAHIDDAEWKLFLADRTRHVYQRNNILFYDHNRPLGLYFLCRGRVNILRSDCGKRQQIVRPAHAPDFVGLRALVAGGVYKGTAVVAEDSVLCLVRAARFWRMLRKSPEAALLLAQRFAAELGEAEDKITDLALHSIRERLAKYLLTRWARRPKGQTCAPLTESRVEIAESLGTTPEAVCRGLAEFRRGELIALEGPRLTVLNAARLQAVAHVNCKP